MSKVNVAVVGATGLVGSTILEILEERQFPINDLVLLASARSAGREVDFAGKTYTIEELTEASFADRQLDMAFFAAGGEMSEKYAPIAAEAGITVIDNSSFFRMQEDVPLVIPEVNLEAINASGSQIIANPNCSTIQSVVVLGPLAKAFGIKRVVYNTYQAVSGSGVKGIRDLKEGTNDAYKYSIQKNVIPQIDVFEDNGYTKEEMKMVKETQKILGDADLSVTATAVRVPIENTHAISINIEFDRDFDLEEVYDVLREAEDIVIVDDLEKEIYPLAESATGKDEVYVGRIRRDYSVDNGINLWTVSDNVRKGAALNAVQIGEYLASQI